MHKYFNGVAVKKPYFEGWYIKVQSDDEIIGFIMAFHVNEDLVKSTSIQVITKDKAYNFEYPIEDFKVSLNSLNVKIKNNHLSKSGLSLDIDSQDIIKGELSFKDLTPLAYDIMGPFSLIKHMECYHGVLSMYHQVNGYLQINDKTYHFDNGKGYIEKDSGTSFPTRYFWTQCFHNKDSIMVACATIPFYLRNFNGCFAVLILQGVEYRLATYLGARIEEFEPMHIKITQGKYTLIVDCLDNTYNHPLKAPIRGQMSTIVYENVHATLRYQFFKKDDLICGFISSKAGYEYKEN